MEIKEINVDERVAMSFLKNNPRNRPLSKSRSLKYAKQMTEGNWQQNGESIIIGWDGSILDGQHRLEGVVLAKTSIKLLFVFGVDPATFPTIDTGTGRSGADTLAIYGVDPFIAKSLSAAIKKDILMSYTGGINNPPSKDAKTTPRAILSAHRNNKKYLETAKYINSFGRKNLPLSASNLIFLAYRFFEIDKDFSKPWMDGFISGAGLEDKDLRLWLRNFFWRQINSTSKRPMSHKVGFVCHAWNVNRFGRTISTESNLYRNDINPYKYIVLPTDLKNNTER